MHPDYVDEIAFVARSLRDNPNSTVQVVGHTDNTGSTAHNQALSERRAGAVAEILTSNGVETWRVQTAGGGYAQPVASNDTPGGRAQNRRVEIVITPTDPGLSRLPGSLLGEGHVRQVHRLELVAVGVAHEGRVVVGRVVAQARRAGVAAALGERRGVEARRPPRGSAR